MNRGSVRERIRRVILEGIELPARAVVLDSRADSSGYSADVVILDSVGERTNHRLDKIAVDPLWLLTGGRGIFAPPAKDQIVGIVWIGDEAGQPMIGAAAPDEPATPRLDVESGQHSHQGKVWDVRMKSDEWVVSDEAGAKFSGLESRWLMRGTAENLHALWHALIDGLVAERTEADHDTDPGGTGAPLAQHPDSIATYEALRPIIDNILRPG